MQTLQAVDVMAYSRIPDPGPSVIPAHIPNRHRPFRALRVDTHIVVQSLFGSSRIEAGQVWINTA